MFLDWEVTSTYIEYRQKEEKANLKSLFKEP